MAISAKSIVVDRQQLGRVDRIVQSMTAFSRGQVRGLFDHRCVRLNEELCVDPAQQTELGDRISIRYDPHQRYPEKKKAWREQAFSIVFEDEDLIVVEKSAHILSVPTDRGELNTLVDRVSEYLRQNSGVREAFVVHRLDRGVSGLVVFAKTRQLATRMHTLFREHKPARTYIAIVQGTLKTSSGSFRSHLATADNLDRYSTNQEGAGELAITHYRVVHQKPEFAIVEVRLETGRRNQIRVHFAEAGHPVWGDARYGRGLMGPQDWSERRLALHATHLGFEHPRSGKLLSFDSPLPPSMQKFFRNNAAEPRSMKSSRNERPAQE